MTFPSAWVNVYKSLIKLTQDATTGFLQGTYSSTTDGSGTYDVVGWASLATPTPTGGQTMAISILWRSNDGGKSDPSHEVSGMCGQVVVAGPVLNLCLNHLFVETNPNVVPKIDTGNYPDKLIFTPYPAVVPAPTNPIAPPSGNIINALDQLTGTWIGTIRGKVITVVIQLPVPGQTMIIGKIVYDDGSTSPIVGFTDIFASPPAFKWQGVTFSTYIDAGGIRNCISMAGYLDMSTSRIVLTQLVSQPTAPDSTWYQVSQEQWELVKVVGKN